MHAIPPLVIALSKKCQVSCDQWEEPQKC